MEIPIQFSLKGNKSLEESCISAQKDQYCFDPMVTMLEECMQYYKTYKCLSYENNFKTLIKGNIDKKTLNTSWKTRYFELNPIRLIYYINQSELHLKGSFNLATLAQHQLQIQPHYPQICLTVRCDEDEEQVKSLLQLKFVDEETFQQWAFQLQEVMKNLIHIIAIFPAYPKSFPTLDRKDVQNLNSYNSNFWNRILLSFDELKSYASQLDLLFFRSKSSFSYLHRFFMGSHFDHVALLLKDQFGEVLVFEAIESRGVCITNLNQLFNRLAEDYEQIGYRKLLFKENIDLKLESLEDYLNSLLGKKYQLSLHKLFIGDESEPSIEDNASTVEEECRKEEKTFFCSELIADVFLKFGIMSQGKRNNYWPKDLQSNEIKLTADFRLSPMMSIELAESKENPK